MIISSVKEMAKSKYMILFIVFMLGMTYINSLGIEKFNNQYINQNEMVLNK